MAVYKLFPSKDTTLYSSFPTTNTGLDEIIEASTLSTSPLSSDYNLPTRFLIEFDQQDIDTVLELVPPGQSGSASSSSLAASFRGFLAYGATPTNDVTLEVRPTFENWQMGTGRYASSPPVTTGANWESNGAAPWNLGGMVVDGNFMIFGTSSYNSVVGGGNYIYELRNPTTPSDSRGVMYSGSYNLEPTQSLNYGSDSDINVDITDIFWFWKDSQFNNGLLGKLDYNTEFDAGIQTTLRYFSIDTHTIYPPHLEIKWDDTVIATSSSLQTGSFNSIIDTSDAFIELANNKGEYKRDEVKRFQLNVRPQFPTRRFITQSIYTQNYLLPPESYWQIHDLDTNEVVIDFDETYTQISNDGTGSYFDVYMAGLEPERYYKLAIQTQIGGETKVIDNKYYFKVKR